MSTKTHNEHAEEHHMGYMTYVWVWITLIILTVVTVAVSYINFGVWNIVIALAIASVKAAVVALFFMHLKYEDKLTWGFAIYPLFLLFLLIGLTSSDVFYRDTSQYDQLRPQPSAIEIHKGEGNHGKSEDGSH